MLKFSDEVKHLLLQGDVTGSSGLVRNEDFRPGEDVYKRQITDRACKIMDTGGIGARLTDGFAEQVAAEADIAMKTADLILFCLLYTSRCV